MKNRFPKAPVKHLGTFVTLVVIFINNVVLNNDMVCNCENRWIGCDVYMAIPFIVVFVLELWTHKTLRYIYYCMRSGVLIMFHDIIKAACIGSLWVVFVLLDGDWYVCCMTKDEATCKKCTLGKYKKNISVEDEHTIAALKNESMMIALGVLICCLLLAAIISGLRWKCFKDSGLRCKCFEDSGLCCKCFKDSDCCDRKTLYKQVILDEEENALREFLTAAAKDKLKETFMADPEAAGIAADAPAAAAGVAADAPSAAEENIQLLDTVKVETAAKGTLDLPLPKERT
ncbi:uncharacterized protein LOC115010445 isoform X2 [Cottoperca gobio]|uniref:Uncharacterized protein LOC115010445 isoform X2 n=1 Tax=Cottoperca gobio TaxID=56716 RepID=A0A6J2PZC1_COTGO|nr:uncharacterized protein LOC115010445 isoform X2 [Cottoperca gobio]XP_029290846.1 uncharacterized protein LOC115010445 isoform X2 [Cottoperca gobio]